MTCGSKHVRRSLPLCDSLYIFEYIHEIPWGVGGFEWKTGIFVGHDSGYLTDLMDFSFQMPPWTFGEDFKQTTF